jgi:hypothetical protein
MPKLQAVVESLDGIDENLRDLYVERDDGKYALDADGVEDVTGLKRSLQAARADAAKARKRVPEDFDPERWEQLQALEEEFQKGKLSDKQREEFDSLKRQLQDQHKKELAKYEQRAAQLQDALRRELVTSRAAQALAKAKGSVKLLLPHIERHATVVEQDGQFVPVVTDEQGHTRIGEGGNNMTFDELVAEMRASNDYAGAFEGTGSSGGGAVRSAAGGGGRNVVAAGDNDAFLAHLEQIAKGEVEVK